MTGHVAGDEVNLKLSARTPGKNLECFDRMPRQSHDSRMDEVRRRYLSSTAYIITAHALYHRHEYTASPSDRAAEIDVRGAPPSRQRSAPLRDRPRISHCDDTLTLPEPPVGGRRKVGR